MLKKEQINGGQNTIITAPEALGNLSPKKYKQRMKESII